MIERLPYYYRKSKVVNDLYGVIQKVLEEIAGEIAEADKQLFIITTDDFTLHEKDVDLKAIDVNDETRRARVIARLQGYEMLTVRALTELVTLYEKSGCTVEENYPKYTVTIYFDNRVGAPNNIAQIMEAVEEVKPAHIKIGYEYVSNTWRRVGGLFTWGEAETLTWNGLKLFGDKEAAAIG